MTIGMTVSSERMEETCHTRRHRPRNLLREGKGIREAQRALGKGEDVEIRFSGAKQKVQTRKPKLWEGAILCCGSAKLALALWPFAHRGGVFSRQISVF